MQGKFWLSDLGKILEQEDGIYLDTFFSDICIKRLPSKSGFLRYLLDQKPSTKMKYNGDIRLTFMGYYDKSGEDVEVMGSCILPADVPFAGRMAGLIADKNGVKFSDETGFYALDKPINDLGAVQQYIRRIKAAEDEFIDFADKLAGKMYELVYPDEKNKVKLSPEANFG